MHDQELVCRLEDLAGKVTHELRALNHEVKRLVDILEKANGCVTKSDLKQTEERIIMKQSEVAQVLRDVKETLVKVGQETTKNNDLIKTLLEKVAAQDNASEELVAAANAVRDQAKVIDDLVPDAEEVPTVVDPGGGNNPDLTTLQQPKTK